MKLVSVVWVLICLSACQSKTLERANKTVKTEKVEIEKAYPKSIMQVFDAHGGINNWNKYQSLKFEIESVDFNEKNTVNLKSRESLIENKNHFLGFDGKNVWLQAKDTMTFKGNAKFYYNLMFYFYAMPFVLADDGIQYTDAVPLQYEGKTYPGIRISYNVGVGESPEDEYILYYDQDSKKMVWLGYTVTYFSGEKSNKFSLIKYEEWESVEHVFLPKKLQWYKFDNGIVGEKRESTAVFVNAKLSKEIEPLDLFSIKNNAKVVIE